MFAPGTILRLRDPQSTDEKPYPYDLVEVVGQSPVQHATSGDSPWAGPDAFGYIIRPVANFAPTLDKPYGELNDLYEVEEYPTDEVTGQPITPENNPQNLPSPEQLLRKAAQEQQAEAKKRTPNPSLQHNGKTPEQVLREAEQKERQATRRRKEKEDKTDA
jgi:hypothetical protein